MAGTSTPIFPQTIKNYAVQILPADTTALKTVVTGATNGTKVEMLVMTSTDTSARDVQLFLNDGSTSYLLGTISIPANSGNTNALLSQSLLVSSTTVAPYLPFFQFPLDSNGNRYIYVASGWTLKAACLTTVTTAKVLNFVVQAGDF